MNAEDVMDSIQKKWESPAFVWLSQVSNATGWKGNRYADGLAVSVWPSRGLYAMGFEIKVSRSDWLRELKQPKKSEEIQSYCRHWWIAAPKGVVQKPELPPTWGLVEVSESGKAKIAHQAPELTPEQPGWPFICAVLRRAAEAEKKVISSAKFEAFECAKSQFDAEAVRQLESKLMDTQLLVDTKSRRLERAEKELESLRRIIELHGLQYDRFSQGLARGEAEAMDAARRMQRLGPVTLYETAKQMREAANALEASAKSVGEALKGAAE